MESTPSLPTCRALLHEKELLKLKALFNMGLLDDVQLKEGVAEVLAPKPSPQAPSTKKRPREVSLVLSASSSVKSNKRQKSILAFGSYTKLTTTKDGEQILISSVADARGVPRASTMFECSQCDFTHHLKCSVALHAKIHSEWAKGSVSRCKMIGFGYRRTLTNGSQGVCQLSAEEYCLHIGTVKHGSAC